MPGTLRTNFCWKLNFWSCSAKIIKFNKDFREDFLILASSFLQKRFQTLHRELLLHQAEAEKSDLKSSNNYSVPPHSGNLLFYEPKVFALSEIKSFFKILQMRNGEISVWDGFMGDVYACHEFTWKNNENIEKFGINFFWNTIQGSSKEI